MSRALHSRVADGVHACSVVSDSATLWAVAIACQAPLCPWDSPGKDTGAGCHALLREIFPTQGSNLHLSLALAGRFFILVLPRKPLAGGTCG